jgi:prevent-host-death family protein
MINVNAADANRSFSKLLRQVAQGESFTVLSHGRPVATLAPAQEQSRERQQSRKALLSRLSLQPATDQQRTWTRDELYD